MGRRGREPTPSFRLGANERSKRTPIDQIGPEALAALYESFDDATIQREFEHGKASRRHVLYETGRTAIEGMISTLETIA